MSAITIRTLDAEAARAAVPALATVLLDCVAGGASVSFMADMTRAEAETFFAGCAQGVATAERALIVAEDGTQIVGTVQVILALPPNQPHRAEVAKMLVSRAARRRGVGALLMQAAEDTAREHGRWLMTLDTVPGEPGERLYLSRGFTIAGEVPGFALYPDGRLCSTVFMYKKIA